MSAQVLRLTGLHVAATDPLEPLSAALASRTSAVRLLDLSFSFLGDAAAAGIAAAAAGTLRAAEAEEAEEAAEEAAAGGGGAPGALLPGGEEGGGGAEGAQQRRGSRLERVVLASTSVGAAGRAALEAAVRDPRCALRAVEVTSNAPAASGQRHFVTEARER